jgi:hypothetical protein
MAVDCSPAARQERQDQIKALREKIYSGVQSISDRSRSVSYSTGKDLMALLAMLQAEEDVCDGKPTGQRRVFYAPYSKWS